MSPLFGQTQYGSVGLLNATLGPGSSLAEARTYNNRTWLNSLSVGSVYAITNLNYASDGNVISATDSVNGTWNYTYDGFNRLAQATKTSVSPNPTYQYLYDRFGNRWRQNYVQGPGQGVPMPLSFDRNNRITTTGFRYDAAGNMVMDNQNCYTYDVSDI